MTPEALPDSAIQAVTAHLLAAQSEPSLLSSVGGGGPVPAFERSFAHWVGSRFALASNSGASALHLALMAVGLTPGDEVLVPTYGWGQVLLFMDAMDLVPRFVDIDPHTLSPTAALYANASSNRTRAVLVAPMLGRPADLPSILATARRHGWAVIEDAAQVLGARVRGRPCGTFGDVGVYSFGPRKALALGEGGMLVTNDNAIYERAVAAACHPDRATCLLTDPALEPSEFVWPYRMHPLAAVLGQALLPALNEWIGHRRRLSEEFGRAIQDVAAVEAYTIPAGHEPVPIMSGLTWRSDPYGLDPFVARLAAAGVRIERGPVGVPLHLRPEVGGRWGPQPECPVAERRCAEQELVLLESTNWATPDQADRPGHVAAMIRDAIAA